MSGGAGRDVPGGAGTPAVPAGRPAASPRARRQGRGRGHQRRFVATSPGHGTGLPAARARRGPGGSRANGRASLDIGRATAARASGTGFKAGGRLGVPVPGSPQVRVGATGGDQLVVRAKFADPPLLDDRHPVGVPARVQPVRDRHHRAPVEHRGERALEVACRTRVEQRCRLIEHQRVRVGEHQPRQRHLLRLRG